MNDFIQSPEVCVVEASAGSGKTYTLAKRYVQLLLSTAAKTPQSFKHILAITFTNKAALEMKGRILDLLKRIALGGLSKEQEQDILKPLGLDTFKAQELALRTMDELIRHYHYFGVLTIDSFMNMLLCGCAFRIHLSAHFKITRNATDYLQLSVDELIDRSYEDKSLRGLFDDFIQQYLFLENRSGWFPKQDLLKTLSTLFNQHNTYQLPFQLAQDDSLDVLRLKKDFLQEARQLKELLPPSVDKRFVTGLDNFLAEHQHGFDVDAVSRYFARPEVPLTGVATATQALEESWQRCGSLLNLICLKESYAVFNPYLRLYGACMDVLGKLQAKDDVLFLGQLNKKAGDLFKDGQMTVEELFYRLATRYRHYLIDEFQDTSSAQWQNLQAMVEEGLSTGGSLFFVGDKKQAIYSFRGGRSQLFDELKEHYAEFNLDVRTLKNNYRSHAQVVAFNNKIFAIDNLLAFMNALQLQDRMKEKDMVFSEQDRQRLKQVFGGANQQSSPRLPHGFVKVELMGQGKKEERFLEIKARVMEALSGALTRFPKSSIAILTRNNEEVKEVTQWLLEAGIAPQSERTTDIKAHPLIVELVAMLSFLNRPQDNLIFADVILGQLFTQACRISPQEMQDFLFSFREQAKAAPLYLHFKERYPELWEEAFEQSFKERGVYPLYELVVNLVKRLHCLKLFPQAQGYIMHFLELIKAREEEACDIDSFLGYFDGLADEDRYLSSRLHDAVRVLTIHKAKGLEFDVVIVPFLEMSIKAGSSDKDGSQSFIWDITEEGMRLMRFKEAYTRFSPVLMERYADEFKESFFAELNNIYVALTRAVWELYVFVPFKVGNSINPVPLLFGAKDQEMGQMVTPSEQEKVAAQVPPLLPAMESGQWMGRLSEELTKDRTGRYQARLKGDLIHYCLSQLGVLTEIGATAAIRQAVESALRRFGNSSDQKVLFSQVTALVERPLWKNFFFLNEGVVVLCEQEMVNRFGETKRIDRMLVSAQEIVIVDFKMTKKDAQEHEQQLEGYLRLAKEIYPGRRIRGVLLYVEE